MAVIDLKNVTVRFQDGYKATGAVNLMAGYIAGATTILVDGITGKVPKGALVQFSDDVTEYTVQSTTETSTNTTSIVISPGLALPLIDDQVITITGVYLQPKIGEGNLTWSEKRPREYKLDRGRLDSVRDGDQVPIEVNFQFMYEYLTASDPSSDPPTPEDVLKQFGAASGWITSDPDTCAPFAVDIVLINQPPGCPAIKREVVRLPYFRYEDLQHDPKAGTIACTGKCNTTKAVISRLTNLNS